MTYYRRNRFTRLVLEKIENDEKLNQIDRDQWYKLLEIDQLTNIKDKFIQFNEDFETKEFLKSCYEKTERFFLQLFHSLMISLLRFFMANTSINGLLQRGSMFVFGIEQFRTLINFDQVYGGHKVKNLLDLGSGDGAVTQKMGFFFENVYVTEMSYTMQWRLAQKGFKVVDVDLWDKLEADNLISMRSKANKDPSLNDENGKLLDLENKPHDSYLKFDVISCLNLLDRCDKPYTLLKKIKNALVSNGLLIVALVLPFRPYVEYNKDNKPVEDLLNLKMKVREVFDEDIKKLYNNNTMDDEKYCPTSKQNCKIKMNKINSQIDHLIENVFKPLGFELVRFTKLPYLCEGNLSQSFYFMIDHVFVFKSVD